MTVLVLVARPARAERIAADVLIGVGIVLLCRSCCARGGHWRTCQSAEQWLLVARAISVVAVVLARQRIDMSRQEIGQVR